jgi:branched-chain amino acid transport system ATP-binding protein
MAADTTDPQNDTDAKAVDNERNDIVLRTDGLSKKFGEFVAVGNIDMAVERGEFRSVIGPNGAGKTTLFNLISGAMTPTSGRIFLGGTDISHFSPDERVKRGLARSFQITTVFNGLTVRENVRLAAQSMALDDISRAELILADRNSIEHVNAVCDDVLGRINLTDQATTQASDLAYGDRRRLEIGLVLATNPEVVLLDEPTAGMSTEEMITIVELIKEVLADKTLILVEHDVELVMDISNKITVLHQGKVLANGTPEEISDDNEVQQAYLGGGNHHGGENI